MDSGTPHDNTSLDVKQAPVSDLVALHTAIVTELLARKVSHTRSTPAADLPKLLVATAYDAELADRQKSWDVEAADRRLLVRGRLRLPADRPSATFAPISSDDFDAVVFVVVDAATCEVVSAVEVPASALAQQEAGASARRIRVADDLLALEGAREVTTEMEKAMARLDAQRFARRQSDDGSGTDDSEPTGWCGCGCGQRTDRGSRFLVMHDRRADSPALRERYGTISGLVL